MTQTEIQKEKIISLHGVAAGYDNREVLSNVNLTIHKHDFVGVIGPNGSGKTTLLRVLMGLHPPTSGTISYFNHDGAGHKPTFGYLPQQNLIDRHFPITVEEVILSGLGAGESLSASKQEVEKVVAMMGLESLARRPIGKLSGGQLQRTLLGRAVIARPEVIVLDEPLSYLDATFEETLYRILLELNRTTTLLMVTHDISAALTYAKTIACVNGSVHTHPNKGLPTDWIHRHFSCKIEQLTQRGAV